jgi:shikimate dehydrogenase
VKLFGLVGKSLKHSFSRDYFLDKFKAEGNRDADYQFFEIDDIRTFPEIIKLMPKLYGLNVTIPYKSSIIPYLQEMDERAKRIGAVNTIQFLPNGLLKGWNTDYLGFRDSLLPLLKPHHTTALIFGDGGASKAIQVVLRDLSIAYTVISRNGDTPYKDVDAGMIKEHLLLINCTPLGMHPDTKSCVDIPFEAITSSHLVYDLVYNPEETLFLKKAKKQGAVVKNGLEMLHLQAEAAWKIWNGG